MKQQGVSLFRKMGLGFLITLFFVFSYFESKHYIFDIKTGNFIGHSKPAPDEYIYDSNELINQLTAHPRWTHQLIISMIFATLAILIVGLWFNNRTYTKISVAVYIFIGIAVLGIFFIGLGLDSHRIAYGAPRMIKNTLIITPFIPCFLVAVGTFFKLRR